MTDPSLHTAQLVNWQQRMRAGDPAARDEMLRAAGGRLERLARKMLRRCPAVRRWAETGDVLQNALIRLLRALGEVEVTSVRHFFALAATHLRWELVDLARSYYGACGIGANHASHAARDGARTPHPDPPDVGDDPDELERWCAFHRRVEELPAEEREVVGLVYYHGWTQAAVAEMFGVSERTVRRRWDTALAKLGRALRDDGPGA